MRSALVAATFALAVFAAPIAEPNPIYKSGGTGCARIIAGVCVKTGKRDAGTSTGTGTEAQLPAGTVSLETVRPVKDGKRSPKLARPKNTRSTEEKRTPKLSRPKGTRSIESQDDSDVDFEPRTIRGGTNNKRTADPEAINRIHGESGSSRWSTRTAEAEPINRGLNSREAEPFGRAGAGRRDAEAEPINRGLNSREAEPFGRAGAGRRDAEPEAYGRAGAGRRDAQPDPQFTRPSQRRTAEAEAEAEPGTVRGPN